MSHDWENPSTFEEAVQVVKNGDIDYEVSINGQQGAFMTSKTWLECVESGGFIDYDGYGDQVDAQGKFIGGKISPSQARNILLATAYILWYNR